MSCSVLTFVRWNWHFRIPKQLSGENFVCPAMRNESSMMQWSPVINLQIRYCMNKHSKHNFYCIFKCMYPTCTMVLFLFWQTHLSAYSWHSSSPRPCVAKLWWRRLATTYLVPCGLSPGILIFSLFSVFPALLWVAVCSLSLFVKGTIYWSAQAIKNWAIDIPAHTYIIHAWELKQLGHSVIYFSSTGWKLPFL